MKTLILLLLFIPITLVAQRSEYKIYPPNAKCCNFDYLPKRHTHAEAWKIIGIFTASTVLDAVGDALNDNGKKTAGHLCNALSIGTLLSYPLIGKVDREKWWVYPISLLFIRASIFDPTYNKVRGLPINYVGNSSLTDKFQQKQGPIGGYVRSSFLIVGFALPLNEL